jgi:hypothetical protein
VCVFPRVKNDPSFASFDTAPSPHRRINAPSLLLAFAHTQGEAGTPTESIWNALVGRNSPVLCACMRGAFPRVKYYNDPSFASFDTAPSPHRRINAPSLLLAFAHTQGEAGTPTEGIWNALVGRNSPVLCACMRGAFPRVKYNDPSFASFDTAPSPHRRINAPSLLLAFAHTQGEAGTPTEGIWNALVGRKSPVLCACRRGAFFRVNNDPSFAAFI